MTPGPLNQCPPLERLEAAIARQAWDEPLRRHVESCARCRGLTERLGENNALLGEFVSSGSPATAVSPAGPIADAIPGYRMLSEVHRGGQGIVYRAVQQSTGRCVAMKVMREGPFAGRGGRARFAREVRLLAQLRHPHIVAIHDSGSVGGMDYFVMDFIEGRPLDEYIQQVEKSKSRKVEIAALLGLFVKVCEAVNAAHLRGIIHRDLKPGNILIDEGGEPHILDFGLGRLADDADSDADAACGVGPLTVTGQFLGSLPWASPEQAAGRARDIDMRSDVYSLGVMLYQALSGRFPYEVSGEMPSVLERIRHQPPAPMRQRAARITPALPMAPGVDATRNAAGVNPEARLIDDEIETITLKCLAKDPQRRYQTAGELARDIRHYLDGEPIEAKRESTLYVLGKHLRRHRAALTAAAAVIIAVAGFAVYAAIQADRQGRLATREREARQAADLAREKAASAAARAEAANTFLREMLSSVDPQNSPNPEVTVREVLDQAARTIESESSLGHPSLAASMRDTLGQAYTALGLYPQGEQFLLAALAAQREPGRDPDVELAATLSHLALLRYHQGRYDEAESLNLEALSIRKSIQGPRHPEVATILHDLAASYAAQRKLDIAERSIREALAIRREAYGENHPDVAVSLDGLAVIVNRQGRPGEAEPLYQESLAAHLRAYGDEHPIYALALNNAAYYHQSRGELATAEPLYRQALAIRRKMLGDSHPGLAPSLSNLGALLRELGRLSDAEPLARGGLEIRRRSLPADHPDIARSVLLLGLIRLEQGKGSEAEPLLRECWEIRKKSMPPGHHLIAEAASVLGECLTALERYDEAEPLLLDSYPVIKTGRGEQHERSQEALRRLVRHYEARGMPERAAEFKPP